MFSDNVPVDIDLMFEQVKWIDPSVYRMHCRLRHGRITREQLKNEPDTFSNLIYALSAAYKLDNLESSGQIEIYNDYENEKISVRKLTKYNGGVDV